QPAGTGTVRSRARAEVGRMIVLTAVLVVAGIVLAAPSDPGARLRQLLPRDDDEDRKSTRLNSSHVSISYAVFCLKKKKTSTHQARMKGTDRVNSVYYTLALIEANVIDTEECDTGEGQTTAYSVELLAGRTAACCV